MRVAITGATGMIGSALVGELRERGDEVTALSRDAARARERLGLEALEWRHAKAEPPPLDALRGRDAVVHLLGEYIGQRWSDAAEREIRDSHVLSTRNLVAGLAELSEGERPRVLVSQSGSGWYGARGAERLDEDEPAGDDFLARVLSEKEGAARRAAEHGVRVVTTRTGVVLSAEGGALERMLPFFKLGVGGPVAGGGQYMPWVHLDDVVGALAFCASTQAASGPFNVAAPEPPTNAEFSKALGRALRRPAFLPVPALALKALYGEMASVVTTGQRAVPDRLQELGYRFRRPDLDEALLGLLR
ncbi:MAG: TIGR01777 family oxidoreductase [Thermoleophilaceae bacterium]